MAKSTTTGHVGPIIFADETARAQLQTHGEVITFRLTDRTTGDTWWRKSRLGTKEGDVHVEEIGRVDPRDPESLQPYRTKSGFESVEAWQQAIRSLNGSLPAAGRLYHVSTRES